MKADLKRLRHLVAVARLGSLSKAAAELHLSQPALSRSIALLEQQYGIKLFERSASGVVMTAPGRETVAAAEQLLLQARNFDHNVGLFSKGEAGEISVGMWPVISSLVLPDLSAHFMSTRPHIHFNAAVKPTTELVAELLAGRIEWLLCGEGQFKPQAELEVENVCTLQAALVVRQGHPLSELKTVTREHLREYPVLCGVEISQLPTDVLAGGVFISDNRDVLRHTTLHSDGYWITPRAIVEEDIQQQQLALLDLQEARDKQSVTIQLVKLKGFELSPLARSMVDFVKTKLQYDELP